jgi:hypothetical protein
VLDPFSRGAIVGLAVLCVAVTAAVAPIRARSSGAELAPPPALPSAGAQAVALVRVARDPFAQPATPPAQTISTSGVPEAIQPLPGNVSDDAIPALPGAPQPGAETSRVTAVVTGAHPYAMVEKAGVHEIKGIGDLVDAQPIIAIDIDGVRLKNGQRFTIDAAAQP